MEQCEKDQDQEVVAEEQTSLENKYGRKNHLFCKPGHENHDGAEGVVFFIGLGNFSVRGIMTTGLSGGHDCSKVCGCFYGMY